MGKKKKIKDIRDFGQRKKPVRRHFYGGVRELDEGSLKKLKKDANYSLRGHK